MKVAAMLLVMAGMVQVTIGAIHDDEGKGPLQNSNDPGNAGGSFHSSNSLTVPDYVLNVRDETLFAHFGDRWEAVLSACPLSGDGADPTHALTQKVIAASKDLWTKLLPPTLENGFDPKAPNNMDAALQAIYDYLQTLPQENDPVTPRTPLSETNGDNGAVFETHAVQDPLLVIQKDLNRAPNTVPEREAFFKSWAARRDLVKILAISLRLNEEVGYQQGMHSIAASILWHCRNGEQAVVIFSLLFHSGFNRPFLKADGLKWLTEEAPKILTEAFPELMQELDDQPKEYLKMLAFKFIPDGFLGATTRGATQTGIMESYLAQCPSFDMLKTNLQAVAYHNYLDFKEKHDDEEFHAMFQEGADWKRQLDDDPQSLASWREKFSTFLRDRGSGDEYDVVLFHSPMYRQERTPKAFAEYADQWQTTVEACGTRKSPTRGQLKEEWTRSSHIYMYKPLPANLGQFEQNALGVFRALSPRYGQNIANMALFQDPIPDPLRRAFFDQFHVRVDFARVLAVLTRLPHLQALQVNGDLVEIAAEIFYWSRSPFQALQILSGLLGTQFGSLFNARDLQSGNTANLLGSQIQAYVPLVAKAIAKLPDSEAYFHVFETLASSGFLLHVSNSPARLWLMDAQFPRAGPDTCPSLIPTFQLTVALAHHLIHDIVQLAASPDTALPELGRLLIKPSSPWVTAFNENQDSFKAWVADAPKVLAATPPKTFLGRMFGRQGARRRH